MEPQVQYAKTSDGVNIAFYALGEGKPVVYMTVWPYQHLQLEWQYPFLTHLYELVLEKRRLIRFDGRGAGLSEQSVSDYSLDARLLDLESVVERLGLEEFALLGHSSSGPLAIAYAARNPDRLSHLVLWNTYASAADLLTIPQVSGLIGLIDTDWEMYTETLAHVVFGWSEGEEARRHAAFMRECVSEENARAVLATLPETDVAELLPHVKVPTLVVQYRGVTFPTVDIARGLASRIPDARLVVLEADYRSPAQAQIGPILEFLSEGQEAEPKTELPEGMAVILFADIVESTALTEQLGDAAFRAKARELDTSLRAIIRECSGTPVEGKLVGDGVLAVFTSARQAIECALRCSGASEPMGLQLHLGIHAGDVIREGNNVYGGAVNIAARIAGASAPGEVLVSDTVRGLARTSAGVAFDDRGEHTLKGIDGPQRLFAVREGGA